MPRSSTDYRKRKAPSALAHYVAWRDSSAADAYNAARAGDPDKFADAIARHAVAYAGVEREAARGAVL